MINAMTLILMLLMFLFRMAMFHVARLMECIFLNLQDLLECVVTKTLMLVINV